MATFLVLQGPDKGRTFRVMSESAVIGRKGDQIPLSDRTVSRRHALVVRQPDGVRVLDDRSLNGVFVNGERVEWSPLRDGDEIVLGCHCLRYLHVETVAASSAASDAPGEPVA